MNDPAPAGATFSASLQSTCPSTSSGESGKSISARRPCRTRLHPRRIRPSGRIRNRLSRSHFQRSSETRRRIARFGVAGSKVVLTLGRQARPGSRSRVPGAVVHHRRIALRGCEGRRFRPKYEMVGAPYRYPNLVPESRCICEAVACPASCSYPHPPRQQSCHGGCFPRAPHLSRAVLRPRCARARPAPVAPWLAMSNALDAATRFQSSPLSRLGKSPCQRPPTGYVTELAEPSSAPSPPARHPRDRGSQCDAPCPLPKAMNRASRAVTVHAHTLRPCHALCEPHR